MGTAAMRDSRGAIAERIEKYPILLKEFGLDRWFCLDAAVVGSQRNLNRICICKVSTGNQSRIPVKYRAAD